MDFYKLILKMKIKNLILVLILFQVLIFNCCKYNILKDDIVKSFNNKELEYFCELVFYREYKTHDVPLFYWKNDMKIKLKGLYSTSDSIELARITEELDSLINSIQIEIVKNDYNMEINYINKEDFKNFPNYVNNNLGFFWINRSSLGLKPTGYILIDKDQSPRVRNHLLREELTQSLGLMNDSWKYPESTFYQGWTLTNDYSELDRKMIQLLYNYGLPYNMRKEKFYELFLKD